MDSGWLDVDVARRMNVWFEMILLNMLTRAVLDQLCLFPCSAVGELLVFFAVRAAASSRRQRWRLNSAHRAPPHCLVHEVSLGRCQDVPV